MLSRLTLSTLLFLTPFSLSQAAEEFDRDFLEFDRDSFFRTIWSGYRGDFYKTIWSIYGPKHSAMYPSKEGVEQIPDELWEKIVKSWYGIDGAPMAYKPHWHAEDRHDQTFESFITRNYFVPVDKVFETPEVVCRKFSNRSEILLYSNGKKWLDLNQHDTWTPYSLTLWEWYNTVAIKSGDVEFIYHGTPSMARWNEEIPKELIEAMLSTGKFEIYVEPNPYRVSGIMATQEDKREYEIFPHLNLYGSIKLTVTPEISRCLSN